MHTIRTWALAFLAPLALVASATADPAAPRATENVILLMPDGLRWQEVFSGADETLLTKEPGGVRNVDAVRAAFWRDTPEARREALMPFLWGEVAKKGQIYGNRDKGSPAQVTNGMHFSYPGYNEVLVGYADPRIDSNDKNLNPNITVFEWLNRKPPYHGKVAAFGCWDVFPYIFNRERCGFLINAAFEPLVVNPSNARIDMINELKAQTSRNWEHEPYDSFIAQSAFEYLKLRQPRVMFLSLNETDAFGHEGKYDQYLYSANRADASLKQLWELLQSIPQYQGKTSIIFTVDHGRGDAPIDWKSHGKKIAKSEFIWLAAIGPDMAPLGERTNTPQITQSQVAATVAAMLGEEYSAAVPQAAPPIADLLKK